MNVAFLVGNLCADPELKPTKNGFPTCTVNLATNETRKNKDGTFEKKAVFHRIVLLGKQAENLVKYQKKGNKIAVVGRIDNRQYEDKDGNKRTISEVVAETVEYLTSKGGGTEAGGTEGGWVSSDDGSSADDNDEIPF